MATRSLNKVLLIGNLTRDPELRYTPSGVAVCSFGLATNRSWTTESGELKEEVEFHRIVAWNKLAEVCSQLLTKGRKVYVEGRLQTRQWQAQDGSQRSNTDIVIDELLLLDSRKFSETGEGASAPKASPAPTPVPVAAKAVAPAASTNSSPAPANEDVNLDDIPF
jgi:single-strand DNA-binding protein